jgi:hypothetical protein
MDMPNSSGCLHAHPDDIETIYKTLLGLGVSVHNNPFTAKDYPYKCQGIMVVELIDGLSHPKTEGCIASGQECLICTDCPTCCKGTCTLNGMCY